MEKRSSFKECPKCGLRNKPTAAQCDFCGQSLGSPDDWQEHIKDLESLNKMDLRRPMDDRTSKRIESTIIRKDAPVVKSLEIKEAGNIGKVLKELDEVPTKDQVKEAEADMARPLPAQDKFLVKETSALPAQVSEPESTASFKDDTIIAEAQSETAPILEEEKPQLAVASPPIEEPMPEAAEPKQKETADQPLPEPPVRTEPDRADEKTSPTLEPLPVDKMDEPAAIPAAPPEEIVPAKEVTVEVVQPPQEDIVTDGEARTGEPEVSLSSTGSHETIKLKLVEVDRPKERFEPVMMEPQARSRASAAIAVLALGSIGYLVVLGLTYIGLLDVAAGLGGGAVSSCMIIYGAAVIYPSLRNRKEDEVYICPNCHERVEENSVVCPLCGSEFESGD